MWWKTWADTMEQARLDRATAFIPVRQTGTLNTGRGISTQVSSVEDANQFILTRDGRVVGFSPSQWLPLAPTKRGTRFALGSGYYNNLDGRWITAGKEVPDDLLAAQRPIRDFVLSDDQMWEWVYWEVRRLYATAIGTKTMYVHPCAPSGAVYRQGLAAWAPTGKFVNEEGRWPTLAYSGAIAPKDFYNIRL